MVRAQFKPARASECTGPEQAVSEHSRPKKRPAAYGFARDNEHAIARVVKRLRVFWSSGDMRFDHLEDEEVVPLHERIFEEATFEASMALGNKRRLDRMSLLGCKAKLSEFVDPITVVLPILTTVSVSAVVGKLITHSRLLRIIEKL